MRRFFVDNLSDNAAETLLNPEESHHVRNVLRLKTGDTIELVNRQGKVFTAQIMDTSKKVRVTILSNKNVQQSASGVVIGQALIKAKKMEFALQKCTELGVDGFYPLIATRSQGNLKEQVASKRQRWLKLIDESCKQCGRITPMILHPAHNLEDLLRRDDNIQVKLLFWEHEEATTLASVAESLQTCSSVMLLFGPEGGLTNAEVLAARSHGYHIVSLGDNILRAETAVIAAVSVVQHYLGNI